MVFYLDTSVIVSIYIPEPQSQNILELLQKTDTKPYLSRLAETEFYAALAIKKRTKEISQSDIKTVTLLFHRHMAQLMYEKVYITDTVFETAIQFLMAHDTQLPTLDALHLACSAQINATLVTADHTLAKSARRFEVPVILL